MAYGWFLFWQPRHQKCSCWMGSQNRSRRRGQQGGLAATKRFLQGITRDRQFPLNPAQQVASAVAAHLLWGRQSPTFQYELVASYELFSLATRVSCYLRELRVYGPRFEIGGVEALFDMQCSWFAVWTDAVPVEQTKRRIAGLLDFGDHQSRTEGMDDASRNKHAVSHLRFELVQAGFTDSLRNGLCQRRAITPRAESGVDFAAGVGVQDHPRLSFPQIGRRQHCSGGVGGMHLHAQNLLRVEQLEKEWKTWLWSMFPEQFAPMVSH